MGSGARSRSVPAVPATAGLMEAGKVSPEGTAAPAPLSPSEPPGAPEPPPPGPEPAACAHLALVQSLYKVSKSFLVMSLQRLTPGWMAPSPRRMRTCSTVHTTGDISSRFSLV